MLAEAVAEMRRRGRPEFEPADLFMDFNGIQVTIAAMARALIAGRIDCKTAGRLAVQLQMASKLLWMVHRKEHKGSQVSPQISAARQSRNQKETSTTEARRHGENPKATVEGRTNSENTEKLRKMRGAEEKTGMRRLAKKNSSRHGTNLIVSSTDGSRLSKQKDSTMKDTRSTPLLQAHGRSGQTTEHKVAIQEKSGKNWAGEHAETRITFVPKMVAFADIRGRPHGPPGWARAA